MTAAAICSSAFRCVRVEGARTKMFGKGVREGIRNGVRSGVRNKVYIYSCLKSVNDPLRVTPKQWKIS